MCAPSLQTKRLQRAFGAVEGFVLLACIYGLALRITWRYDVGEHPHVMALYRFLYSLLGLMLLAFLIACGALLLGAPFFVRRLRWSALIAWAIGAAGLLWAFYLFRF